MSRLQSLSFLLLSGVLVAAPPAPRFPTAKVGALEVTALRDGELHLSPGLLKDITAGDAEGMLGGKEGVPTPVNAFLVRLGKDLVLVDTGGNPAMDPALGHMVERLKEAGVDPASIKAVLITHFHGDHIGGLLTPDGQRAFPNAVVRVAQAESDYWLSPATEAALPEARRPMIAGMKKTLAPYQAVGAFKPFAPGEAPYPGVRALPAPGHTPGHSIYAFDSGKHTFYAVGDIVHFGKVQFQRPEVTVAFDSDTTKAAATRLAFWKKAAAEHALVGPTHVAPGLGHVAAKGQGYVWEPLTK
jgi:glyoxylase-like metal-dependent hydrolase (beta-lactamase superfamily II)